MPNRKRPLIILISVLCVTLLSVGGVHIYRNRHFGTEFVIEDNLPRGEGRRARVILLGGQSNASGCARDEYLQKNVSEEKYAEYQGGFDNVYINYYCTGTNESRGFVRCAAQQGEGGGFFGPELGLAEGLAEAYPDEQFFIIKYAVGGSNLYDQWLSPSSFGKTGRLYKQFVSFVRGSLEHLVSLGYDVTVEGMCWMQGESDSLSRGIASDYGANLTRFIEDVRKTFKEYAADGGIAFVDATIADNFALWVYCDIVNAEKREVERKSPINFLIDTNAEGLTCSGEPEGAPDTAHYDSLSELKLGHLFAGSLSEHMN